MMYHEARRRRAAGQAQAPRAGCRGSSGPHTKDKSPERNRGRGDAPPRPRQQVPLQGAAAPAQTPRPATTNRRPLPRRRPPTAAMPSRRPTRNWTRGPQARVPLPKGCARSARARREKRRRERIGREGRRKSGRSAPRPAVPADPFPPQRAAASRRRTGRRTAPSRAGSPSKCRKAMGHDPGDAAERGCALERMVARRVGAVDVRPLTSGPLHQLREGGYNPEPRVVSAARRTSERADGAQGRGGISRPVQADARSAGETRARGGAAEGLPAGCAAVVGTCSAWKSTSGPDGPPRRIEQTQFQG